MVEFVGSRENLFLLEKDWFRLEEKFTSPLQSHEWFFSGATAFCPPYELKIGVVRHGSVGRESDRGLEAIAPLGVRKEWIRKLEVLGTTILTEEGSFLFQDEGALTELVDAVIRLRMPVFLRRVRIRSEEARIWEREISSRGLRCLVREERLPWVAVRGKWEEFERQMSSSRKSSFRRLLRLAEAKGEVRFDVVVPTVEDLDRYLKEAFEVEASSWKGRRGTAMKLDPRLGDFFREYARRAASVGELYIFFMRVDGKAIAAELTTVRAGRLWILKIGHDEAWSWCSPGILLMNHVVKYCFEKGLEACEFGGTDEPWLHIWANETHSAWTYRIYPGSLLGLVKLVIDLLHMTLDKIMIVSATRVARKERS